MEPNTNVDVDATDVEPPEEPQKIWPLFLLGVALMGLGYYFVFVSGDDGVTLEKDAVEAIATIESFGKAPKGVVPADGPMLFELKKSPRVLRYELSQSTLRVSEGDVSALETRVALDATDKPIEGQGLVYDRSYDAVDVDLSENGEALGGNVPEQVEELLETAKHRLVYIENGRLEDYTLRSSGAAQLRQMLTILTDAASFAAVQFPREAVNVDEPWSYELPYSADSEEGMSIRGKFIMQNVFVGTTEQGGRTYAVIEQDLRGSATGVFAIEEKEAPVKTEGMGRGVFFYDIEKQDIANVEITFEQVSSVGSQALGVQSTSRIQVRNQDFSDAK